MPTQIAATPVIRESEALKILDESKQRPTVSTRRGAEKLKEEFADMVKETPENKAVTNLAGSLRRYATPEKLASEATAIYCTHQNVAIEKLRD